MTTIVTVLTDGFADWETTLLNAVAHAFYGVETRYATPDGEVVTSSGGMRVLGDLAIGQVDPQALDALIVCGGTAWQQPGAPDIGGIARSSAEAGKVVGAICDGTLTLARAGLLNRVAHTSNAAGYLDGPGYSGTALYTDVPHAVRSANIVTAPGTAPVSFMAEVMSALGRNDDNLAFYVGLHARQHDRAA